MLISTKSRSPLTATEAFVLREQLSGAAAGRFRNPTCTMLLGLLVRETKVQTHTVTQSSSSYIYFFLLFVFSLEVRVFQSNALKSKENKSRFHRMTLTIHIMCPFWGGNEKVVILY